MAIVEFLTFRVAPDELDGWLEIEERHWTRFLERQDGFLRKEMWRPVDDPGSVHAAIWWNTFEQWKSIPADQLDAVERAMGVHERTPTCQVFDVLREH